jgi:hypothetical protein
MGLRIQKASPGVWHAWDRLHDRFSQALMSCRTQYTAARIICQVRIILILKTQPFS